MREIKKVETNNFKLANSNFQFIWCEIKSIYLRHRFLKKYSKSVDAMILEVVERIKKAKKLELFPYDFVDKYKIGMIDIKRDKKSGLLYTIYDGKPLFLSRKYRNKFMAKRYIKNILMEQDQQSPHCYLSDKFEPLNYGIIFDVGAAEGIFALKTIDSAEEVYLFECNEDWVEALQYTFRDYEAKVRIIKKLVSNKVSDTETTLDAIALENNIIDNIDFIKMDIEGYEELALEGAKKLITGSNRLKMAICTYHLAGQERRIREMLTNFTFQYSEHYMIYYYDYDIEKEFLRHGVLRMEKV